MGVMRCSSVDHTTEIEVLRLAVGLHVYVPHPLPEKVADCHVEVHLIHCRVERPHSFLGPEGAAHVLELWNSVGDVCLEDCPTAKFTATTVRGMELFLLDLGLPWRVRLLHHPEGLRDGESHTLGVVLVRDDGNPIDDVGWSVWVELHMR